MLPISCHTNDIHFFPHLKGAHFTSDDEVKQAVTWIKERMSYIKGLLGYTKVSSR
jgi:hypothetical protein